MAEQPPFSHQHVLIQWGGKLPGGETWSCSLRCAEQTTIGAIGTQVPPQIEVESWMNGSIATAVQAYHTRGATAIHNGALLSFVKANRIGLDGKYMDDGTLEHVFPDIQGGGANYGTPPNQSALAVSLTTGFTRGPAHRGRFYLPMPSVRIDVNTGLIVQDDIDGVRGSTKVFLEAIADVPGIDAPNSLTPVVMSRKKDNPRYRVITGVEVGRVMDTQRRRRKNLKEMYSGVALNLGVN